MRNLEISQSEITWEKTKTKFGSEILYKNQVFRHVDHISICKTMYVNGEYTREDLVHIPLELIDQIKALKP